MIPPEIGLIISGLIIAAVAMAIGIGGGILWTPLLILVYGASPQEAIAASLMIQVAGMGSGSVAYLRAGLVERRLALTLFLAALPGVILGSVIVVNLPDNPVQMALGTMSLVLALVFVSAREELEDSGVYRFDLKRVRPILPVPAFFGLVTGFLSVGIGEWVIPVLKNRLRLDMNRAIATVIPVMFLLALTASLSHGVLTRSLNWDHVLWGGLGTIIGGQIGPFIARKINERFLKESFIYLMTLIGIHLIFHSI